MTEPRNVAISAVDLDHFFEKGLHSVAACNKHWSFWPWRDLFLFCSRGVWFLVPFFPPGTVFFLIESRQQISCADQNTVCITLCIYFVLYIVRVNTAIEGFAFWVYYLFYNQSNISLLLMHLSSNMVLIFDNYY